MRRRTHVVFFDGVRSNSDSKIYERTLGLTLRFRTRKYNRDSIGHNGKIEKIDKTAIQIRVLGRQDLCFARVKTPFCGTPLGTLP